MFEDQPALAWTAMPYRAKVVASDGTEIGSAESLMGDVGEDIFHGIAVRVSHGRIVEIPAVRVTRITAGGVSTDLAASDVVGLEPYREEKWYEIGWGGLFRKHPEWQPRSGRG